MPPALGGLAARTVPANATDFMHTPAVWYCYAPGAWGAWDAMNPEGPEAFPATGRIRPQYDYAGADAAIRIEASAARLTPGPQGRPVTNTITWTAAAKPFGYLNATELPNTYGLVLPAFHDVALIPVDASSAPSGGGYNLPWREHIEQHLQPYMDNGPSASSSCFYCRQLDTWEDPAFRQSGVTWLSTNSYQCVASGGPGGGYRGGGTSRGH